MASTRLLGKKTVALILVAGVAVSACTTSDDNTYSRRDVGQIIETTQGRVISSRNVEVQSENTPIGAAAGGAAGGVIGNTVGSGAGNTLATVAGVLLGAGIGYLAERELRSNEGVEYLVEMEDGRTVTIVQNSEEGIAIPDGSPVLIQFGAEYTRIVQIDESSVRRPSGSGSGSIYGAGASGSGTGGGGLDIWQNPDLEPSGSATQLSQSGNGTPLQ